MESVRINKFLADCGVCSRRDADKLIAQGRVRIGQKIAENGDRVSDKDIVYLNGKAINKVERTIVIAFYKPVGVTCSERDEHAKHLVKEYIKIKERVTYAGRLDKDSEGLLLMTNDGYLIDYMMRAVNHHEKEYVVKVNKEITEEFVQKMSGGIYLPELDVTTRPCELKVEGKYTFKIILTQGYNRQIRRMCKECGYEVKQLKRIRIMNIELKKLLPGQFRYLTDQEIEGLRGKDND